MFYFICICIFSLNPGSALLIVNPLSHTLKTDWDPVLRFLSRKLRTIEQIFFLFLEKFQCLDILSTLLIPLHYDLWVDWSRTGWVRPWKEMRNKSCRRKQKRWVNVGRHSTLNSLQWILRVFYGHWSGLACHSQVDQADGSGGPGSRGGPFIIQATLLL